MSFDYFPISRYIWRDEGFRALSEPARLLWVYLLTNEHRTPAGLYRLPVGYIESDLKWKRAKIDDVFREILDAGLVRYDWDAEILLIPNSLKYLRPANENMAIGWARDLNMLPATPLLGEFFAIAQELCSVLASNLSDRFNNLSEAVPEPLQEPSRNGSENRLANSTFRSPSLSPSQSEEEVSVISTVGARTRENGKPVDNSADVKVVFAYWQEVMGKEGATFTEQRRQKVKARLGEGYTVEQLKLAIDGCKSSAHNMGDNDRNRPFNDLELICRNATKVEQFLEIGERTKKKSRPADPRIRAYRIGAALEALKEGEDPAAVRQRVLDDEWDEVQERIKEID